MLIRLSAVIAVTALIMFFASGCDQLKDYRKKVYYEKGLNFYEEQEYKEAFKNAGNALEFDPNYFDAIVLAAKCQYALKDYKSAAETFQQAFLLDESRTDISMKAADAFYRANKFGRALVRILHILKDEPDNPQALCLGARIRLRSRKLKFWSKVDTSLQPLLDNDTYKDEAHILLAEFNILNDDLAVGEQMLMDHYNGSEDWFFVMRLLAKKYDKLDERQSVVRVYREILKHGPDSSQDVQKLLYYLRKFDRKEEEEQLISSMIAVDDQQLRYTFALIDFHLHYRQLAEAEKLILAGIESGERYVDFARCLLEVYEKTERYAAAIQLVKDVLGQLVDEEVELKVEFMNHLARLYFDDNNQEMAKFVVRWVLELDVNSYPARFLLARISLDEGRTLLAIAELRALSAEDADNPDYDYYMGLAHIARGESSNAEQSFYEALKKDPSHKQALLELSKIYLERGFLDDVDRLINDFLAITPDDPDVLALHAEVSDKISITPALD